MYRALVNLVAAVLGCAGVAMLVVLAVHAAGS